MQKLKHDHSVKLTNLSLTLMNCHVMFILTWLQTDLKKIMLELRHFGLSLNIASYPILALKNRRPNFV